MNRYIHTTLKMSIACIITIFISEAIGLTYAITAGILAVLSIQLTRKDAVQLAVKRLTNAVFGLILATLLFVVLGYNVYVYMFYVLIFIGISFYIKLPEGIVPTLVLAGHLLAFGSFSILFLGEEFLMIFIAVGVALILNTIYPMGSEKKFLKLMSQTDQALKDHVLMLSFLLKDIEHPEDYLKHFETLNQHINHMLKEAILIDKDMLFDNDHRYLDYINMRNAQLSYVNRMYELTKQIKVPHENMLLISKYVEKLSFDIGYQDRANPQLEKLRNLLDEIKAQALPDTRDAFETRAILFQMVFELESFLMKKITYHQTYK